MRNPLEPSVKIFIVGASGFIGQRLLAALGEAGYEVFCGVRDPAAVSPYDCVAVDFTRDHSARDWVPRLTGVDVVVNLVGILRERQAQMFSTLHDVAPRALFAACVEAGVSKVVQVSALGADAQARSRYHVSKRRADEFLASLPLQWTIVQPSLVFGTGGASAGLFITLAALPLIPLPGRGDQLVQPIHIDDLCAALVRIVETDAFAQRYLAAVGPHAVTFRQMIEALRAQLGLPSARCVSVPLSIVRFAAKMASRLRGSLLDAETIDMLERGNTAPAEPITQLLGRSPRPVERFIAPHEAGLTATAAKMGWLLPLLRASVGIVWIAAGIVSLGIYPVEQSYELLARVGVSGALAPVALYGAAALDLLFGAGVFVLRRRRWLWRAQIALIVLYSAIIAWMLPEFWLHPFGPLLKNIPLLAAIVLLDQLEKP